MYVQHLYVCVTVMSMSYLNKSSAAHRSCATLPGLASPTLMKQRVLGRPPVALVSSFTRDTTDYLGRCPGGAFERLRVRWLQYATGEVPRLSV
jgi:hypothetical protein